MKYLSSVVVPYATVAFTRSELLEDSRISYSDIGWLSAKLVFTFMVTYDIEESEAEGLPYSYICRYLKGSIPTWRLEDLPCCSGNSEICRALQDFRRFLRIIRNNGATGDIDKRPRSYVIANLKTGKSAVFVLVE